MCQDSSLNLSELINQLLQVTNKLSWLFSLSLSLFCTGTQTTPVSNYRLIDVRDVASAHIQAFEVPSAAGRYCLVGHVAGVSKTLKILRQLYPTLLPEK